VVRGTARSYRPEVRDLLEGRLTELAHSLAAAYHCAAQVDYERRYPPLVTYAEQTAISLQAATALVGAENVNGEAPQLTGSEDFSFMLEARPGGFVMIGNGVEPDGSFHNVHTPGYDFNEEILTLGAGYWVSLVREELAAAS
jgi:hippurate hydrolase